MHCVSHFCCEQAVAVVFGQFGMVPDDWYRI